MADGNDSEARLAALTEEYLEQLRQGRASTVETFAAAHPQEAAELRELLPALVEVEGLGQPTAPRVANMTAFPENLGGYRIIERIGCGGMGAVFRAVQESLNREVAVKILSPAWNADAHHCAAFENESRVIARLRHTNIVEIYGAGHEGEYRYYVMSLVNGCGVTPGRIRKAYPGVPYEQAVARVGLQAAQALAFAHAQGVLHRDVKPGNLLLDDEGVLHVGDFGLATVLNSGETAPLVTQSHDGTLRYMAPERLSRGENSFAGDQYSLGLTLYELLTHAPAYQVTEPGALIHRICSEPLPPLRGEGELGAIINKAVSHEPRDRYPDMDAMAADLQRYLDGLPVLARPASCLRRYALWWRRRPAVAAWSHTAAAALVLLLVSVSVGYVSVRRSLAGENEQRLRAEKSAQIADASLRRIFASMVEQSSDGLQATKADVRLLQDLMPYYEEVLTMGGSSSGQMAAACSTLADIALQTGDAATAEAYARRALELEPKDSPEQVPVLTRLIAALREQGGDTARREADALCARALQTHAAKADASTGAALIRMARGAFARPWGAPSLRHPPHGKRPPRAGYRRPAGNRRPMRLSQQAAELRRQAVELAVRLSAAYPGDSQVALARIELLEALPPEAESLRRQLAPGGESQLTLMQALLEQEPDNAAYRRAYLQLVSSTPPQLLPDKTETLRRAGDYARTWLADHPGDTEALMQYLRVRESYTAALHAAGQEEQAERENSLTLGVLSLLTSRADFSPEMRERLVMLVSLHPAEEADQSLRASEIDLLLQSYDARRLESLRKRIRRMREEMQRRRPRPERPRPATNGESGLR
ncbi:MAG: protein kinase [Akkermansia sp.]